MRSNYRRRELVTTAGLATAAAVALAGCGDPEDEPQDGNGNGGGGGGYREGEVDHREGGAEPDGE